MATPEEAQKAHAVEILGGVARDLSHPVAAYYRGLLVEGLGYEDALHLTADFARKLLDDCANPRR